MALDQGTTNSRTILYNEAGETIAVASEAFSCQYPEKRLGRAGNGS